MAKTADQKAKASSRAKGRVTEAKGLSSKVTFGKPGPGAAGKTTVKAAKAAYKKEYGKNYSSLGKTKTLKKK